MSSLMQRMAKTGVIDKAAVMAESQFFNQDELVRLPVHMMNVAYSGRLDGGFGPGMHLVAGPSKHFKSNLSLILVKAWMDKYPEGVVLFYDSEFGSLPSYFEEQGIDTTRVLHIPIKNMEEFKFDVMKKLEELSAAKTNDRVMIFVDSLGNLASKKEIEDSLKESSAADMTRAKVGKSLARMVTPYLTDLKIPFVAIQHTYDTMEMYAKKVVSGGQGWMLSSHSVFIMGKRQVKPEGKPLEGFDFVLNAEKSRHIKEKSAIPVTVTFEGGIDPYSGLYEVALATGHVKKPTTQSHVRPFVLGEDGEPETRLWKKKELGTAEFWDPILADPTFKAAVQKMFALNSPKTFTVEGVDGEPDLNIDTMTGEVLDQ